MKLYTKKKIATIEAVANLKGHNEGYDKAAISHKWTIFNLETKLAESLEREKVAQTVIKEKGEEVERLKMVMADLRIKSYEQGLKASKRSKRTPKN